jgi:hypothetical protein
LRFQELYPGNHTLNSSMCAINEQKAKM